MDTRVEVLTQFDRLIVVPDIEQIVGAPGARRLALAAQPDLSAAARTCRSPSQLRLSSPAVKSTTRWRASLLGTQGPR